MAESLSAAVQAALAPAARYVGLVTEALPGSADELLARPDVDARLAEALAEAHDLVAATVEQAWLAVAVPDATYRELLADVARQYAALAHLRGLVRHAHAAAQPAGRPAAVRHAIAGWARQVALRSQLTVAVAEQAARTARTLAQGKARKQAGEKVYKRWEAREGACHWCRNLHGVTIGLEESFLSYVGGPADLSGHGRLTQPPKPYRGQLQGPPLHPRCRCKIVLVSEPKHGGDLIRSPAGIHHRRRSARATTAAFTAAAIRAMPEEKYKSLIAFLDAALHELGQVLARLRSAA